MLSIFFTPDVYIEGNFSFKSPNKYYHLFAGGDYITSEKKKSPWKIKNIRSI